VDPSECLTRVRQLLASLPGPYGNGHMRTLLDYEHPEALYDQVHAFVTGRGAGTGPDAAPGQHVPRDGAELAAVIREIDLATARSVFEGLTTRTLAYRTPGRYPAAKAAEVFSALARLLGPRARWLTNRDLTAWRPVTGCAMDALFIGTGSGVLIAILVTDED
jgi:hypothetical protein